MSWSTWKRRAVGATSTVVFYLLRESTVDDAEDAIARMEPVDGIRDDFDTYNTLMRIGMGVTGAAIAMGVVVFFVPWSSADESASLTVSPGGIVFTGVY